MDDGRERRRGHGGHDAKTKVDEATACVEMPGEGTWRFAGPICYPDTELFRRPRVYGARIDRVSPPQVGESSDEQTVVPGSLFRDLRFSFFPARMLDGTPNNAITTP